jgi:UDP-N-acetylmuramyl pentapeptide phosphotransferase/UDP-N-acetylglucosamine-1-phosphate transferase
VNDTARRTAAAVTAAAAAAAARGAYAALRRHPPAGAETWARQNHRGEQVTLLEGLAVTGGAVAGSLVTAAAAARRAASAQDASGRSGRPAGSPLAVAGPLAIAGTGAVAFGLLDDLRGSAKRRGLRGHLGALRHGEVTTGTVKLAGLAATGLAAALAEGGDPVDIAVNAGLVAGGANLLNLFDLRPGRAIKVAALFAALIGSWGPEGLEAAAGPAGAALALLPEDLGERAMLGDAGANALGAMLGAAAAVTLPRGARAGLLAGIVALTVASEKVSFTKVIAASPPLNWLDMLGRRPPQGSAHGLKLDRLVPAQHQPRQSGKHRRRGTGETRRRSGSWWVVFVKAVSRREP